MDIMNGELARPFETLRLRRIVIENEREVLRQCRVPIENPHEGGDALALPKLAVIQNDDG
jgi:hypothetical protein